MKNDKLLSAFDGVKDEMIEDAAPRGRGLQIPFARIAAVAACLFVVVGVVLGAILMGGESVTPPVAERPNPDAERPFPEVPRPTKSLAAVMQDYLLVGGTDSAYPDDVFEPGNDAFEEDVEDGGNGTYVETTDNQIAGVIEADICKTTDRYIFRYQNKSLYIYSIDGENSKEISSLYISSRGSTWNTDMFLSEDGKTVTVIQEEYTYREETHPYAGSRVTFIYSIDVSDVKAPSIVKTLGVAGGKKAVRKIDGRIYLVSAPGFDRRYIEVDDLTTYVPGIIEGDTVSLCSLENIYYNDEIERVSYVYVNVFDEDGLTLDGEYAILAGHSTWVSGVHFTKNHIAVEYQSGRKIREENGSPVSEAYTELDLIDFSGESLRYRGCLGIRGWAESGQYSYDEKDGYLRIVTSNREWLRYYVIYENVSLYAYDLGTMELAAAVEDFAPTGERATAVRFEGDTLYVCTAETASFSDPVFFFDLSDYGNITQVNTGYIEGFSSTLIDYGDGYLIGIGRYDRERGKISVYKREGEMVLSVAEFLFYGTPCTKYKSYLIDREQNIFGFACDHYRIDRDEEYRSVYVILRLDEGGLCVVEELNVSSGSLSARAFLRDGYVYYTGAEEFRVVKLSG